MSEPTSLGTDPSPDTDRGALRRRLATLSYLDERRLRRRLDQTRQIKDAAKRARIIAEIDAAVDAASVRLERRIAARPEVSYPPELPVSARKDDIAAAIAANQVVIIAGETGSGKTTQLPKICLEVGRGVRGMIGHTQPRRIAARTVAERISAELGVELGGAIGYQVRFTSQVAGETSVKVMTDGILLAEIQRDKMLSGYDTIIIDEAHERSLNIDFILGYLKNLLPKRPDLKVIITSATIDPGAFAAHFNDAPIIEVSGRTYPVEVRYRPLIEDGSDAAEGEDDDGPGNAGDAFESRTRDQTEAVQDAVDELLAEAPGDILVFLSGEQEIRDTADALAGHLARRRNALARPVDVIPLYARLSAGEQHRVFQQHSTQRIVLATNVAETSLTVPGIKYVIDTGTARISRYSARTKVQRLPIERISQASANQRSGRCGRTSPGICVRLYSEDDFDSRPEFTDPEILRTNLASVILQMASLGFARTDADLTRFPFLQPPDVRSVRDGRTLLTELGALRVGDDGGSTLTEIGRSLAQLPIDPRLARMVVEADKRGCAAEVFIIAAGLSIQDPRERPAEHREAASTKHRRFSHEHSDFLAYLNLWNYMQAKQRELSSSQFRKMCRNEFLNFMRLREWQDLVAQLRQMAKGVGIQAAQVQWAGAGSEGPGAGSEAADSAPQDTDALADQVHRALLSGLLTQIGVKNGEKNDYLGTRGAKFAVFPGSGLFKKPPRHLMAAELVETSRLWARVNARIDPAWIEELGGDLLKRNYSEPHWEKKRGAVVAFEKVTLLGVPIVASRKVNYGRVDPVLSRELFIRHALVEGDWSTSHKFFAANRRLIDDVADLESRARRRDLLVDDEKLFEFYDSKIGAEVVSAAHFDAWWKKARAKDPHLLDFSAAMLLAGDADEISDQDYPSSWPMPDGSDAALTYQFEPGADADGVTVHLPVDTLNQVEEEVFSWQIPGLREDLVTALIRSLPKPLRRNFVPAPDVAGKVLETLEPYVGDIRVALAAELGRLSGIQLEAEDFDLSKVPDHLLLTFRVVDDRKKKLRESKDLGTLRAGLAPAVQVSISRAATGLEKSGLTSWDFGELPAEFDSNSHGRRVRGYPALMDDGTSVSLRVLDRKSSAAAATWAGVRRLVHLGVPSPVGYVQKHLSNQEKLTFARDSAGVRTLLDDCAVAAIDRLMVEFGLDPESEALPVREASDFEALRVFVADRYLDATFDVVRIVERVLSAAARIDRAISKINSLSLVSGLADLRAQVDGLLQPGFVAETGWQQLQHLPRYLTAAERRLDKLTDNAARDRQLMERVRLQADAFEKAKAKLKPGTPPGARLRGVRWMLEELRVSFFAQELGTVYPISEKRIAKALAEAQ
ncbi:ATP-dependent RNA helicase HrpA [Saxibacter everestensis]|uniref:ATP-dependent RNA helicase HrpA n=1 Tax=Saxibacter everestensis TaxID=2909229 RepID=A0ABY8QQP3_9MICO|nr:ATP-dependent RNA helicase HrpA [Brevibacteriaceae bacterium ZFBP1038]